MRLTDEGIPPEALEPPPKVEMEPEHRRTVIREKAFEIVVAVTLIVSFVGFMMWQNAYPGTDGPTPATLGEAVDAIQSAGFDAAGQEELFDLQFVSSVRSIDSFDLHLDLAATDVTMPINTALVWLTPKPGDWPPSDTAFRGAVDAISDIAVWLAPGAGDGLDTAVRTMTNEVVTPRPHRKGVAGTADGWKITYITYSIADPDNPSLPALVLAMQPLSVASNPAYEKLGLAIHTALREGADVKAALRDAN